MSFKDRREVAQALYGTVLPWLDAEIEDMEQQRLRPDGLQICQNTRTVLKALCREYEMPSDEKEKEQ